MIKMLDEIFEEIAPEYEHLMEVKKGLQKEIDDMERDLKQAELNYDVESIAELSESLNARKITLRQVSADLRSDIGAVQQDSLYNRIFRAMNKAAELENEAVQPLFAELNQLKKQAAELEAQIKEIESDKARQYQRKLIKFNHFFPSQKTVVNMYTYIRFYGRDAQ